MWSNIDEGLRTRLREYEKAHHNADLNSTSYTVLQDHIIPPPKQQRNTTFAQSNALRTTWSHDFPAFVTMTSSLRAQNNNSSNGSTDMLRITIHPLANNHFPQYHRFILSNPSQSIFLHWQYTCTPFNFRTLVDRHVWNFPETAGDAFQDTFNHFGGFVMDRVKEVTKSSDSISQTKASLHLDFEEGTATLRFFQVVNEYRKVDIVSLDFTTCEWEEIRSTVKQDFRHVMDYHGKIKSSLIQVLDIVSKHQPTLLLTDLGFNDIGPTHPRQWQQLLENLIPSTYGISLKDARHDQFLSAEQAIRKKQEFCILTRENEEDISPVLTKTIQVLVRRDMEAGHVEEEFQRLSFTIFGKGSSTAPSSYFMRVTDPDDIFFDFTSKDITPSSFEEMLCSVDWSDTSVPQSAETANTGASQLAQLLRPPQTTSEKLPGSNKKKRMQHLGFHPYEGIGGVIGVIAHDCLAGVEREPERYRAIFHVGREKKPNKKETESNRTKNAKKDLDDQASFREFVNDRYPRKKAKLVFYERVHFRTELLLECDFQETDRWALQKDIQRHYGTLQAESESSRARLDKLLSTIRKKNYALSTLVSKIKIPTGFSESEMRKESGHQKYVLARNLSFPSPERDGSMANKTLAYKTGIELPKPIPSRGVSPMKIPIQSPTPPLSKKEAHQSISNMTHLSYKKSKAFPPPSVQPNTRLKKSVNFASPFAALVPYQIETNDWRMMP